MVVGCQVSFDLGSDGTPHGGLTSTTRPLLTAFTPQQCPLGASARTIPEPKYLTLANLEPNMMDVA